jgi:hypothetical protein
LNFHALSILVMAGLAQSSSYSRRMNEVFMVFPI